MTFKALYLCNFLMRIGIILFIVLIFFSCSTVSKKVVVERLTLKNQASEHTKTALYYLERYDYDKALEYFGKSLNSNMLADNIPGIIRNYVDLGKVYLLKNQINESLKYYNLALELYNDSKELKEEKVLVLNGIGEIKYYSKEYEESEKYFDEALKIARELKNNTEITALINLNISKAERSLGNTDTSLTLLFKSLNLYESLFKSKKIKNTRNLALCYYLIGQNYYKQEKYDLSESCIFKALRIDKLIENSFGIADDYFALGMLSEKLERSDEETLKYFLRSRQIYKLMDSYNEFLDLTNKICDVYYRQRDLKNYIQNKMIVISVTKGQIRRDAINEVFNLLDDDKIKKLFTDEELKKLLTSIREIEKEKE